MSLLLITALNSHKDNAVSCTEIHSSDYWRAGEQLYAPLSIIQTIIVP